MTTGRTLAVAAVPLVVIAAVAVVAVTRGTPDLTLPEALAAADGRSADQLAGVVVPELRVPRLVVALVAGAALGLAGALLQGALRNPLAGPELLGVTAGAGLVIATLLVFGMPVSFRLLPGLALLGAMGGGAVVVLAARRQAERARLILVGAAVATVLNALIIAVVAFGAQYQISLLFQYLLGSLANLTWNEARLLLPWAALTVPAALLTARALNLLRLDDDVVEGLGLPVLRTRLLLLVLACALVAPVVAIAGGIGWVSLLAPHLVRQALGTSDAWHVLPLTALTGAAILLTADQLARLAFAPLEVPVGAWTTLVGGPLLFWLLRRRLATLRS